MDKVQGTFSPSLSLVKQICHKIRVFRRVHGKQVAHWRFSPYRRDQGNRDRNKRLPDDQKTITELTDILDQDIETIVALRKRAERKVSRHQRLIERFTSALG